MIRLCEPALQGNEVKYVFDALARNQLSGADYVRRFEDEFARQVDMPYAVAVSSGTAALHLMLLAVGAGPGDEIIVPALTYIATANAVTYCGATPVAVDVDADTWTLNAQATEAAITTRTVGILAVDLYGVPPRLTGLEAVAARHNLWLMHDSAEGLGTLYNGKAPCHVGGTAAYSFFGNKTITTGEGGMVVTKSEPLANTARLLRGQGADPTRRYYHIMRGYNYRMTELQGAVGLAQAELLPWHVEQRQERLAWYKEALDMPEYTWQAASNLARSGAWLAALLLPDSCARSPQEIGATLLEAGIETRPIFPALPDQPIYADLRALPIPNARRIAERGICLPLHAHMTRLDVVSVCGALAMETRP